MKQQQAEKEYTEASELCRQGKYAKALVILRRLNQAFPENKDIVYARAKCLAGLGRIDESLELCRELSEGMGDPRGHELEAKLVIDGPEKKAVRSFPFRVRKALPGIAALALVSTVGAVLFLLLRPTNVPDEEVIPEPLPVTEVETAEPVRPSRSQRVVPVHSRQYEVNHSVMLVTEERRSYDYVAVQLPIPVEQRHQKIVIGPRVRIEPLMDRFVRVDEPNSNFEVVETPPYGARILCVNLAEPEHGQEYTVRLRYSVEVFNLGIDSEGLALVPYSRLGGLDESIGIYLDPEKLIESDRDEFRAVYNQLFPAGIDGNAPIAAVASTIYDWVLQHCTYTKNAAQGRASVFWGALDMLNNRRGECSEYAALFVAVCRAAGIPARTQAGFLVRGTNNAHVWTEFYVPDFGWVPADPSMGDMSPGRDFFARIPGLNRRVSVTHGFDHILGNTRIHSLQSYNYWFRYSGRPAKLGTDFQFTAVPS